MGGSITMIIREKDKVHKMCRWTNSFPSFFKNPKFSAEDPTHLAEYLAQWQEMNEDYKKNKKTGKFEHNMTSVYIPSSGVIAPVEYGLILVDYVDKRILSCQGYSSIDTVALGQVSLAADQRKYDASWQEDIDAYQNFVNSEKAKIGSYNGKKVPKKILELEKSKDLVKDIQAISDKGVNSFTYYLKLDLSPFTVINYPDDKKGLTELYNELKKVFTLTKADEKQWAKHLSYLEDEE